MRDASADCSVRMMSHADRVAAASELKAERRHFAIRFAFALSRFIFAFHDKLDGVRPGFRRYF